MVTAARSEPGGGDVFLLKWQLIQDTFHARAEAAFRAACEKWPSEMSEVLELTPNEGGVRKAWVGGDWSKFADNAEEKASGAMPRWLQEKLRIIAPVVATTGGSLVLAVRLCVSEAVAAKRSQSGSRPLTAGEITENWEEVFHVLHGKFGSRPEELEGLFAAELEALFAPLSSSSSSQHLEDADTEKQREALLAANPLYQGIELALSPLLSSDAPSATRLYIACDRPAAVVAEVLGAVGLHLAEEQVVESGDALECVKRLAALESPARTINIIDDNAEALRRVTNDLSLVSSTRCFFAEWGYSTPSQRATVAAWPRVTLLDVVALRQLLAPIEHPGGSAAS